MAAIPPSNSSQFQYQEDYVNNTAEALSLISIPYPTDPYAEASSSTSINATAVPSSSTITDKTTTTFQDIYSTPSSTPPIYEIVTSLPAPASNIFTQADPIKPPIKNNLPTVEQAKAMCIKDKKQISNCQYLRPDSNSPTGDSLLLQVCEAGREDLAAIFIENMRKLKIGKTRPEQCNKLGETCLHKACKSGNLDTVLYAILKKTKISLKSIDDKTTQPLALKAVDAISAAAAPKNKQGLLDKKTKNGESALKLAVMHGHFDIVRALIYFGASYEEDYHELLKIAIARKDFLTAYFLLLQKIDYKELIELQNPLALKKWIPFECEQLNVFLNLVKIESALISHLSIDQLRERAFKLKTVQAIMPFKFPRDRKKEIWTACVGDVALFKILEHRYDTTEANMVPMLEYCLGRVASQDNIEFIDVFNQRTEIFKKLFIRFTPTLIFQASQNLAINMLRRMKETLNNSAMHIEKHEKIVNNTIITSYISVCKSKGGQIVKLPEIQLAGHSPLAYAIMAIDARDEIPSKLRIEKAFKTIEILLEFGFNTTNILTYLMLRPRSNDETLEKGRLELAKFLIENRADVNAKTPSGVSCLTLSISHNYLEIKELLSSKGAILSPHVYVTFKGQQTPISENLIDEISAQDDPSLVDAIDTSEFSNYQTHIAPQSLLHAISYLKTALVKKYLNLLKTAGTEIRCVNVNAMGGPFQPIYYAFNRKKYSGGYAFEYKGTPSNFKEIRFPNGLYPIAVICKLSSNPEIPVKEKIQRIKEIITLLCKEGLSNPDRAMITLLSDPATNDLELEEGRLEIAKLLHSYGVNMNGSLGGGNIPNMQLPKVLGGSSLHGLLGLTDAGFSELAKRNNHHKIAEWLLENKKK